MEFRVLTPNEEALCRQNLYELDRFFSIRKKLKCANCSFPLSVLEENSFSLSANGKICDLCHALEAAISVQPGLKKAHDEWKVEQDAKKKMLDKDKYF